MKQKSVIRKIASLKRKTCLPIKQRLEQIIKVSKETEYAEDVAEEVGLTIPTLIKYSCKYKIKLPPLKDNQNRYNSINPKRDPRKDRLIKRGLSTGIIGKKTGVHRERIPQYILGTGQYEKWRQSRKKYKENKIRTENERKNAIKLILSQIDEIARRIGIKEDKWAYEKTEEYFKSLKHKGIYSFETIFSILKDYHELQEKGEKKSLDYFAKKYNIWTPYIGNIFKIVGVKSMLKPHRKQRVPTPKYKKQSLERAIEVKMPLGDITYFLELSNYTTYQFFCLHYKRDKKRPKVSRFLKKFGNSSPNILTYRKASQIYEALDCGFSCQEITDSYNISQEVYNYAIEARGEISKHIIDSLRFMFPDREIKKPYKEFRF